MAHRLSKIQFLRHQTRYNQKKLGNFRSNPVVGRNALETVVEVDVEVEMKMEMEIEVELNSNGSSPASARFD